MEELIEYQAARILALEARLRVCEKRLSLMEAQEIEMKANLNDLINLKTKANGYNSEVYKLFFHHYFRFVY